MNRLLAARLLLVLGVAAIVGTLPTAEDVSWDDPPPKLEVPPPQPRPTGWAEAAAGWIRVAHPPSMFVRTFSGLHTQGVELDAPGMWLIVSDGVCVAGPCSILRCETTASSLAGLPAKRRNWEEPGFACAVEIAATTAPPDAAFWVHPPIAGFRGRMPGDCEELERIVATVRLE